MRTTLMFLVALAVGAIADNDGVGFTRAPLFVRLKTKNS